MSPRVRVIRFARVDEAAPTGSGELVARVRLDESSQAAGLILRTPAGWHYQPTGEARPALASPHSRQDLERQIVLYHLGSLPATDVAPSPAPSFAAAS